MSNKLMLRLIRIFLIIASIISIVGLYKQNRIARIVGTIMVAIVPLLNIIRLSITRNKDN